MPEPNPPRGYKVSQPVSASPPAGYVSEDDMFLDPKDTTEGSVPYWVSDAVGKPKTTVVPKDTVKFGNGQSASAFVYQGDTKNINVEQPASYNSEMAAHESTHLFQNSRNKEFTDNLKSKLPDGTKDASAYEYGGVKELIAKHPSIGKLNAEQQAKIVGDLARNQAMLHKGMTKEELKKWDETKQALERSIEQLVRTPPKEKPTVASSVDDWMKDEHPALAAWLEKHEGVTSRPVQHAWEVISNPKIDTRPMPVPSAPSVALGYANPSKYVR